MNYRDYFLAAVQAELHRRTAWVISAFALIREGPDDWKKDPYPYRIVQTPTGHFFVDPEKGLTLSPLEGTKGGVPPLRLMEGIDLPALTYINQPEAVRTTYGNVIANLFVLVYPFGDKIKFKTGRWDVLDIEKFTAPRLLKTLPPDVERDPNAFYVDEHLRYCNGAHALTGFTQLCVPAHTEKMLTVPPGTKELRDKLLEQYKDRLTDPAAVAEIDKALIEHYRQWIKGDRSEGFLITKKSIEIVRKKLMLMHGAEMGLLETVEVDLIQNSLREGWDIDKFAAQINSSRAGAFYRGAQTELGGVAFKDLLRASANIRIIDKDCGVKLGLDFLVEESEKDQIIGYNTVDDKGQITMIDEDNYGSYLGKQITLRSPLYCALTFTDYCSVCVGRNLSKTPTAASMGIASYGSAFLSLFLKLAHGKQLATTRLNWKKLIT